MNSFGLGDLAYYLFRPFAWAIDRFWGTDLMNCDRCHERRLLWNGWFSASPYFWLSLAILILVIILAYKH